ncbi:MAG: beta-glucuronidase [Oscillospiraceae bacterium]|nr:beta-glucuronidase [Oscillospiraceae bacterium]
MTSILSLDGTWQLCTDPEPCRYPEPPAEYPLHMQLPGTTAQQQIGSRNPHRSDGCLTENYPFSGQIWLRKCIRLKQEQLGIPCFLYLERTRITKLWVNGKYISSENSLCTPHVYDLTGQTAEQTELILCIRNTDYPTRGGHMTSPDTQTNWIGITGKTELIFHSRIYFSHLRTFPCAADRTVTVKGILFGAQSAKTEIRLTDSDGKTAAPVWNRTLTADSCGQFSATIPLPDTVSFWSEYHPAVYTLTFSISGEPDSASAVFGLRDFRAAGDHFEINGIPVMLRGKHDGMVFPLTGAAPADTESWLHIFRLMKEWGINHYRFHTCCPPEAAFAAADLAGIYMEPELPFWGTIDAPNGEKFNGQEQEYLIREGLRICEAFGNHPSFCMLSLGNELWGDPKRLGEIIERLRNADPRPLYTQGSNNFQHMPLQIPQEDFWTGVRTGKGRLLRGSFADCDAPLGRIQTAAPSAAWDYEANLTAGRQNAAGTGNEPAELDIQYGTGVKRVKASGQNGIFVPDIPVVTHEIGQYNIYPDYSEIPKYTGVTRAGNLEIFRERLEAAGMANQAEEFFRCSGAFSRECYKAELEAAMRSPHIAGFQILDLQDFPGQGTALVGMMNALLGNKGLTAPEYWRGFCGDLVPLAVFDSFVWEAGKPVTIRFALRCSREQLAAQPFRITLQSGSRSLFAKEGTLPENPHGLVWLGGTEIPVPEDAAGKAELVFEIPGESVRNMWQITVLPPVTPVRFPVSVVRSFTEAEPHLLKGERVLLLPEHIAESVEGFYCTDFWNYHMFRIISESMKKKVPVGTMGLCMNPAHPVTAAMFSEPYSTPQWYMPVTHADCAVLDAAPEGYRPIVQMIDNTERNHRLGLIFETAVSGGKLLICTVRLEELPDDLSVNRLSHAIAEYMQSEAFAPAEQLSAALLKKLFG